MDLPIPRRLAIDFNLAAAGTGFNSAMNVLQPYSARASLGHNVAGSILLERHVPAAGLRREAAANAPRLDGAAARIRVNASFDSLNADIARASANAGFISDLADLDAS